MAPKAEPPNPSRSSFLFVNEDAKTVTKVTKNPVIDREKKSHVQRLNFAQRQRIKQQPYNVLYESQNEPSMSDPSALSPTLTGNPSWQSFDAALIRNVDTQFEALFDDDKQSSAVSTDAPTLSSPHSYQPGHYLDSVRDSKRTFNYDLSPTISLTHSPLQARTIHLLFSGSTQKLEQWAPPLMQYFNTVTLRDKFFMDSRVRPLGESRHAEAIHNENVKAMSEPVHLYTFLAAAAAMMLRREGKLLLSDVKEHDYRRTVLSFNTKAVKALRLALARGINHDLAIDVYRFIATASFSKPCEPSNPHFEAMVMMIEALGGISTFSGYFQESHILLEWSTGLKKLKPVRLPLNWDPGRGDSEISKIHDSLQHFSDGLGLRMAKIVQWKPLRPDLTNTFFDLVEFTRFQQWVIRQNGYNPAHFRYLFLRQTAIGPQLLSMIDPTSSAQERVLCIALIFCTALTRSPSSGKICASEGVFQLQNELRSTTLDSWGGLDDLLLWILVIGGLTAIPQDQVDWFASLAASTAKRIGGDVFADLGEMEKLLTGFVYEPSMQREPLLDFRLRMARVDRIGNSGV